MRTFTAFVNPISGGGSARARFDPLADALRAGGAHVQIVRTRSREHAVDAAAGAAASGDIVVAVGGDGLVRDVATGCVAADGTMAIVPAGRGNDLASALKLPTRLPELARLLLTGAAGSIDVLDADGVIVPGNVYAGLDSLATQLINANRRVPARVLYRLAPVAALARWQPVTFTIETPDATTTKSGHIVVIANSGCYGHGLRIVPGAVVDDGLMDVLVVGAVPKRRIAAFMRQARTGAHVRRPEVTVSTSTQVTVRADRAIPVGADGDIVGTLPLTVTLRPAALRILVPSADPRR